MTEPCRPDTDAQDPDSGYPKTVNDYLSLLSCYWADTLDPCDVPDDVYFATWEHQARPLIERLLTRQPESTAESET